jgi:hypothetical protein
MATSGLFFPKKKIKKILLTCHSPPFFGVPQVMKISLPPPQKKNPLATMECIFEINGISNHLPLLKGALTIGVGKVVANNQLHLLPPLYL